MLIRRPVAKVFEAFVESAITSKFWFSRGSGKLEAESPDGSTPEAAANGSALKAAAADTITDLQNRPRILRLGERD
jgi:uncharacterized protein YndB with AHSA1/START domain